MKRFILTILFLLFVFSCYATERGQTYLVVDTEANLPTNRPEGILGYAEDTKKVYKFNGTSWSEVGGAGETGVPSGMIAFIISGTCPSGWTEVSALNGKTILGTIAGNSDIGTTGGSDTLNITGIISQPTFTGIGSTAVVNHVHIQTGHTSASGGAGIFAVDTNASGSNTSNLSTANPTGGVTSYTPEGTISTPTFTGDNQDNRSAWIKVICCQKD